MVLDTATSRTCERGDAYSEAKSITEQGALAHCS